jgi:hypothetical protein
MTPDAVWVPTIDESSTSLEIYYFWLVRELPNLITSYQHPKSNCADLIPEALNRLYELPQNGYLTRYDNDSYPDRLERVYYLCEREFHGCSN